MTLTASLSQLEREQMIRRMYVEEPEYTFKHALMQDVARGSLLISQRRALHRAVAQVFELQPEFCQDEFAPVMAFHFAEAGDDANTLRYSILAGDAAAHKYASAEAIAHYTRALDAATRTDATSEQLIHIFTKRGRVLELAGRYAEAAAGYDDMLALATTRDDPALEVEALLSQALITGIPSPLMDVKKALDLAERALALAQTTGNHAAEAKALWNLQLAYRFRDNDYEQSARFGERALAIAHELGLREQVAYTLGDLAPTYWALGDTTRARQANAEATALWRALGNVPMQASTLADFVMLAHAAGEWDDALAANEEVLRLSEQCGNGWAQVVALRDKGYFCLARGDTRSAVANFEAAVALGPRAGFAFASLMISTLLAPAFEQMGNAGAAAQLMRQSIPTTAMPVPVFRSFKLIGMSRLKLLDGDLAAASALGQQFMEGYDRRNIYASYGYIFENMWLTLAQARGDSATMLAYTDEQLSDRWRVAMRGHVPDTLWFRAQAFLMQSRADEAYAALQEARRMAEPLQWRQLLWKVYAQLSEIERQRGNLDDAAAMRDKAREMIDYIAEHAPDDLRATFLAMPDVKGVTG